MEQPAKSVEDKRANDKRLRILSAAIEVFAAKGFYGAKISEIARQANVADGTIYLYFDNKDELLIEAFEATMEQFIVRLEAALLGVEGIPERIRAFIEHHLGTVEDHPSHAAVVTVELRQSPKFMRDYKNPRFGAYLRILTDILEDGREQGVLRREVVPWLTARALFGMLDELALTWVLDPRFDLRGSAEQVYDIFMNGMRATPSP